MRGASAARGTRVFVWVFSAAAFAAFGCGTGDCGPPSSGDARAPNILWVVWDTVRADRMSLYGHSVETTPELDRWARGARVYRDVVSAASTTEPAHASMFTGLYPSQHGTDADHRWLSEDFDTLAERLSSAGYRTYLWSANPSISADENFHQGFDRVEHPWDEHYRTAARWVVERKVADDRSSELHRRLARGSAGPWAIKAAGELVAGALERWLGDSSSDQPWFAVLNYMEAHRPLVPERHFRERVMPPEMVEHSYAVDRTWIGMWEYTTGLRDLDARDLRAIQGTYDAAILELDGLFADLLDSLEAHGDLENTMVILTADHGELLGENHMLDHQFSLHGALVRIPLVIHFPARFEPGVETRPVSNMDLYPTLLEVAGVEAGASNSKAVSLLNPPPQRARLAEYTAANLRTLRTLAEVHPEFDPAPFGRTLKALYVEGWKLLRSSEGEFELFDLEADPSEEVDVFARETERGRVLQQRLEALVVELGSAPTRSPEGLLAPTAEKREMLESLGYLAPEK
ncbi:MAG: sulfatase-like hydrolase/transferase [Myxococcota bacterium]